MLPLQLLLFLHWRLFELLLQLLRLLLVLLLRLLGISLLDTVSWFQLPLAALLLSRLPILLSHLLRLILTLLHLLMSTTPVEVRVGISKH